MHDMGTEQIAYTVREPRWAFFPTGAFCVFTFVLMGLTAWTWHDESRVGLIVLIACCGLFLVMSVLSMLELCLRSLMVLEGGRGFIYRNMFGKKTYFSVRDIGCVLLGSNGARGPYLRILHKDEHIICTLELNMVPVDLLFSEFEEKGIPIRGEDASDRLTKGGLASRKRAQRELELSRMSDEEYHAYAASAKRFRIASIAMEVVTALLSIFVSMHRAITFEQTYLFFACWPLVFLGFGVLGRNHYSLDDRMLLQQQYGTSERLIETVVTFPCMGMIIYILFSLRSLFLINNADKWAMLRFVLLEMALVMVFILLVGERRRINPSILLLLPFLFGVIYPHAIHLNWTLGTKHTEIARVVRTEIVEGENNDYYVYVNDESGQPVRYAASGSIVTKTRAGDTVTLLINDSIFGIRQIIVRK